MCLHQAVLTAGKVYCAGGVLAQTENWIQWSGGEVESGGAGNGQRSPAPARLLLD